MAEIVIVSQLRVQPAGTPVPAQAAAGETLKDLRIVVSPAAGGKCERCWMYSEEVGKDEEYPDLCPRCAAVLRQEK
jgi:isoleucyl-tRNA synthetase